MKKAPPRKPVPPPLRRGTASELGISLRHLTTRVLQGRAKMVGRNALGQRIYEIDYTG